MWRGDSLLPWALCLAFVLNASAAGPLRDRTLSIPGRCTLLLSSPHTWSQQTSQPLETLAPTIRFSSTAAQRFVVVFTAFWSLTNDSSFNSPSNVRTLVEDTVDELDPWLVEKDIPILGLRGGSGTGYYPDEYKYLAQGAIAVVAQYIESVFHNRRIFFGREDCKRQEQIIARRGT
jgi:hypothetical protein